MAARETNDSRDKTISEIVNGFSKFREKDETATAESYFERFPELKDDRAVVLAVLEVEYHARKESDPTLRLDEFESRWPDYYEDLRQRILPDATIEFATSSTTDFVPGQTESNRLAANKALANLPQIPGYEAFYDSNCRRTKGIQLKKIGRS